MLNRNRWIYILAAAAMLAIISSSALAQVTPVVKTVRVLANNPTIPHDVISGTATRLKGTSNVFGTNIQYTWSFGDGSPNATGTVTSGNYYALEAAHTYTGPVGSAFVARLTVRNTVTSEEASSNYNVVIEPDVLATRVNVAIDEGLWYLHKTMTRTTSGSVPVGYWSGGSAGSGYYSNDAVNVNSFEVNGFLQSGPDADPYTETVSRGLNMLFTRLAATAADTSETNPQGTFNPDADGNGLFVYVNQSYPFYQGGPVVDAIVASGTPNALAPVGPANIVGRTYRAIVQDMVDYFAWGQYDLSPVGGGWRYNANEWPDNSVCQWVAIGVIAAERQWGILLNPIVKTWNAVWLTYSQNASTGYFGYTNSAPIWGPYAVTPSGMVQLTMDGLGRGDARWDRAETFMRNNFGNGGGGTNSVKEYYYGLFSFTKSMLLHDSNNDGIAEPITMLHSTTPGVPDIDWYRAEVSNGDPTDGVAKTLVGDQNAAGYWFGHYYGSGTQGYFETAWAIIMLRRTVVELPPIAVADAFPNPALAGLPVSFDGGASFSTNPERAIVTWEWDLDNNGTFETAGVTASRSFPSDGNYTVVLRVTDNGSSPLTDTDTLTVVVRQPPIPPSANAGGPYNLCENKTPWFLDGSGSVNPDEGISEPGQPGNTIIEYAWELDGDNDFNDAMGVAPNITGLLGVGPYLIQLRVTDNSALSHPSYPPGGPPTNLFDTDTAQLRIRAAADPLCTTASCVSDLLARAKPTKADLTWTWRPGAHHYYVYRGTTSGGPYLRIATVSSPSLVGGLSKGVYADFGLTNGVTYYYIVREAAASNEELCQSNQTSARPVAR